MRVLQVAHGFPPYSLGGVEHHVGQLAHALRAFAVHSDVFCRMPAPSLGNYVIREEELAPGSVLFMVVNNGSWGALAEQSYRDPRIGGIFEDFLGRRKPDLVHFHHTIALSSDLPERALRLGVPCVMTLHDYWLLCPRIQLLRPHGEVCSGPEGGVACASCIPPRPQGLAEAAARKVCGRLPLWARIRVKGIWHGLAARRIERWPQGPQASDAEIDFFRRRLEHMRAQFSRVSWAIAPSRALAERYAREGFDEGKLRVVPHGLAPMARRPAARRPGQRRRFCFIGSIMAHKGLHVFLDAMEKLGPCAEGVIYGQRPDYDYGRAMEKRLRQPGLAHVRWFGLYHPEDLPAIFAAIDALVVPSIWPEAFSLVTREAFQAGVPVVASALGGMTEGIAHEGNGLLVPPGDADALREAMERLVVERGLLERLTQGARKTEVKEMPAYARYMAQAYAQARRGFLELAG